MVLQKGLYIYIYALFNFQKHFSYSVEGVELSKEARALGFPVEHKHRLACLRQELIDSFVEARYVQFIKHAAVHLQQLTSARRSQKEKETTTKVNTSFLVIFLILYFYIYHLKYCEQFEIMVVEDYKN